MSDARYRLRVAALIGSAALGVHESRYLLARAGPAAAAAAHQAQQLAAALVELVVADRAHVEAHQVHRLDGAGRLQVAVEVVHPEDLKLDSSRLLFRTRPYAEKGNGKGRDEGGESGEEVTTVDGAQPGDRAWLKPGPSRAS